MAWSAPASGSTFVGAQAKKTANQSIANNTATAVSFEAENFDTDAFHDNSTNNSRMTIPSGKGGKYLINCTLDFSSGAGARIIMLYKNGALEQYLNYYNGDGTYTTITSGTFITSVVATDYLEIFVEQSTGTNKNVGDNPTKFSIQYLGA